MHREVDNLGGEAQEPPRQLRRSPYLWAVLAGLVLIPLSRPLLRFEPPPPPVLARLPDFRLLDQRGVDFGSEELRGRVWVASFFFSRCQSVCPSEMQAMAKLAQRYREAGLDRVHLVSITVDPTHDSAERLRAHGERFAVDPRRWHLLTGPAASVRELVEGGFGLAVGQPVAQRDVTDVAHSNRLVLVDGTAAIRGYYRSDELGIDEVFHRSRHVLQEREGAIESATSASTAAASPR